MYKIEKKNSKNLVHENEILSREGIIIYQIIISFDDFIVPKKVKNLNDHFGPNMSPI